MEATVRILDWVELPTFELIPILRQGAVLRLPYLKSRLWEAQKHVKTFEDKYATTYSKLNSYGLPDNASYEMHEDFIEWEYWAEVAQETNAALNNVETILSKIGENVRVSSG